MIQQAYSRYFGLVKDQSDGPLRLIRVSRRSIQRSESPPGDCIKARCKSEQHLAAMPDDMQLRDVAIEQVIVSDERPGVGREFSQPLHDLGLPASRHQSTADPRQHQHQKVSIRGDLRIVAHGRRDEQTQGGGSQRRTQHDRRQHPRVDAVYDERVDGWQSGIARDVTLTVSVGQVNIELAPQRRAT